MDIASNDSNISFGTFELFYQILCHWTIAKIVLKVLSACIRYNEQAHIFLVHKEPEHPLQEHQPEAANQLCCNTYLSILLSSPPPHQHKLSAQGCSSVQL